MVMNIYSVKTEEIFWDSDYSWEIYSWLQNEIGSENWDWSWNKRTLIFANEEDKVKFILRWL